MPSVPIACVLLTRFDLSSSEVAAEHIGEGTAKRWATDSSRRQEGALIATWKESDLDLSRIYLYPNHGHGDCSLPAPKD
jgi:hypothetical protein